MSDVEDLVICVLTLLWGFRPRTVMNIALDEHVSLTHEALTFTEAFRKGY